MAKAQKQKVPKSDTGLPEINFTTNWNGKLFTDSFTTIRMWNPDKYIIGQSYKITQGTGKTSPVMVWGQAKLVAEKKLIISQVNEFIAQLDTGYSAMETQGILRKMYGNSINGRDIEAEPFGLYLLVKEFE